MPEIREIIDNNNKVTGYTLSGKRYNSLDEARAASKAEYAATDYDSVLETTDPNTPFMRRNPWIGDAIRGILTGAGYLAGGTLGSVSGPVGTVTGGMAGGFMANDAYSRLQKNYPNIFGPERSGLTRGIEILSEPGLALAGKGAGALANKTGLKEAARNAYLRLYGRPRAEQDVLQNVFDSGTTPTIDVVEQLRSEGLNLTPGQISGSDKLLNVESISPNFRSKLFSEGEELAGIGQRLKSDIGLQSELLPPGSEGQTLRGVARSIAAKTLQSFRAQKKAIGDILEVITPEKQIVIPGKKYTSSFVDATGKPIENIGPSTILNIKGPIDIKVSQAYAKDAIKDLEKIKNNDRIADNLKKDIDPLINILQHYAQSPNFEAFRRLDDVRNRIGKYAYRVSAENTDKLKALYGRINEDIGKAMDQEPALRQMWDTYRANSSKFIGAKESNFGKKLLAKVWEERYSSESIVNNALNSTEDWLRAKTLLGDQGAKELLLNEMMFQPSAQAAGAKFWGDTMGTFAAKHSDKFKQTFSSDERNRIQRFIHGANLANRSWGRNAALAAEQGLQQNTEQGIAAVVVGSPAYFVRAISGIVLRLTDKDLAGIMLDKEAGEAMIKIARERQNTFASDMAGRKLIKRALELGIPLTSSSGLAVMINPATGEPTEVEPPDLMFNKYN